MSKNKSNNKPPVKKKSALMKTLQWLLVSAVSLLLVAYFIFSDMSGPDQSVLVGRVDGRPVYYSRDSLYARNYQQLVQNMQSFGGALDAISGLFEYQAFVITANQLLLYNIASKNIDVTDSYIVDNIKGSFFLNDDYTFRAADYDAFVRDTSAANKKAIENDVRQSISIQTINHEMFQTVKSSTIAVDAELAKENNTRSIELLYANASSLASTYTPTGGELDLYFAENKTNFVQADLSWIKLKSISESTEIYNALKKDIGKFEVLARSNSEDEVTAINGGNVGYITSSEMPSSLIADAVFKTTKEKTLLEPMYFNDSYYTILVNKIRVPENRSDVSTDVVTKKYIADNKDLLMQKAKDQLVAMVSKDVSNIENLREIQWDNFKYYGTTNYYYAKMAHCAETEVVCRRWICKYQLADLKKAGISSRICSGS